MKSIKTVHIFFFFLIVLQASSVVAQNGDSGQASRRKASYDAFVQHDMDRWLLLMTMIENMESPTLDEQLELIRYYYGYSAYQIGMKKNKIAKVYVKKGDELISRLLKQHPENATILAFKGTFTGFKVVLNKIKIITMGPESIRYVNRAYKADPENLQAITDKANLLYFTPRIFGGNKKESLGLFEKAIAKIESNNDTKENWFYLSLLILLSAHYEKQDLPEKSLATQEKLFSIEPNLQWVKDEITSKMDPGE